MSSEGRRERSYPFTVGDADTYMVRHSTGLKWPGWGAEAHYVPQDIYTGKQVTVSENHRYLRDKGRFDGGGPFYTAKALYHGELPYAKMFRGETSERSVCYDGPIWMPLPSDSELATYTGQHYTSNLRSEDTSDLDVKGVHAVSQVLPTNPNSHVSQVLAEIYRDGLPIPGIQAWKNRTEVAKAAGSEYLNAVFGWQPLVEDVNEFLDAIRFHDIMLKQYERDEGKLVRREFNYPIDRTSIYSEALPNELPSINTGKGGQRADLYAAELGVWKRSVSVVRETRVWFKGAFTYKNPRQLDSWQRLLGYSSEANKLFGLSLTPDVLWELAPWSWAIDWFTDAGDVIKNLTAFKLAGLVMPYGYIMEEISERVTVHGYQVPGTAKHVSGAPNSKIPTGLTTSREVISKVRRPAHPFGFGFRDVDLSLTQKLIMTALGLTKL